MRYKFPQDDEYKLHISYSIYEVGREEDRSVGQMIDKLNIVDAKPTFKSLWSSTGTPSGITI